MQTRKQYILLEMLISVLINVVLSIGFVYLIFHGQAHVATTGIHGIVLDMVPQTFMVTLMGSLVPMLLTRRRLPGLAFARSATPPSQSPSPFRVALLAALLLSCLVFAICWVALPRLLPDGLGFHALLRSKAAFGGLLALVVTPWALRKALR